MPLPGWFKTYVTSFAVATLLLPLLTVVVAPLLLGGEAGALVQRAAAPPLFLLLAQLAMESTTESCPRAWAALIRILNPIGFNAFRLLPLTDWLITAATIALAAANAGVPLAARLFTLWGALLAAANLLLWIYNLFGFLLLKALPLYLDAERFAT